MRSGEARKLNNMNILGMSDHTPLPDNRWSHVRMDMSELDAYDQEFRDAATDGIILLKGLECEWDPAYERFYRDARVFTIYEGTSEIQRIVISNQILNDKRKP